MWPQWSASTDTSSCGFSKTLPELMPGELADCSSRLSQSTFRANSLLLFKKNPRIFVPLCFRLCFGVKPDYALTRFFQAELSRCEGLPILGVISPNSSISRQLGVLPLFYMLLWGIFSLLKVEFKGRLAPVPFHGPLRLPVQISTAAAEWLIIPGAPPREMSHNAIFLNFSSQALNHPNLKHFNLYNFLLACSLFALNSGSMPQLSLRPLLLHLCFQLA